MFQVICSDPLRLGSEMLESVKQHSNIAALALGALVTVAKSYYDMTLIQTLVVSAPAVATAGIAIKDWLQAQAHSRKQEQIKTLEDQLKSWIQNPEATGNKKEAADRILLALKNDASYLNLQGLGLTHLPDSFYHFNDLRSIDLSCNSLTVLPPTLGDLPDLKCIYLVGNTHLKEDRPTFQKLRSRCAMDEAVYLKFIKLELEEWKRDPTALGSKELASERILEAFKNKSTILTLNGLGLTLLPGCIGALVALQELNLGHNQLTSLTIPPTLIALQRLNLGHNQLTSLAIPTTLIALQRLNLGNNRLRSLAIPTTLIALQELYLGNNQLRSFTIPTTLIALQELNLYNNQLRSLAIPTTLIALQQLYLGDNQLTSLEIPSTLVALQRLSLICNQLTSLEIPSTLVALQRLYLHSNQLTSLTIPSTLTALQYLYLSNNRLTSLPAEIGNCLSLKRLEIDNNHQLQALPMSLCEIPGLTNLDIGGTLVPEDMQQRILASARAKREGSAAERLPQKLELWSRYAEIDSASLSSILGFEDSDKIAIDEWLTRLARSSDFSRNQKDLAKTVCSILQDSSKEAFKEVFLNQIKVNNECCQDRAAMALNELYVAWCLLCPKEALSAKEELKLLIGASKTLALRAALGDILQTRPSSETLSESVEIYLYYELAMREPLGLLTAIQSMSYSGIGRKDWISEDTLKRVVQESYLGQLVALPIFESFLMKDTAAQEGIDSINEKALDALVKLGDCPKGGDESGPVLEWHIRNNLCKKERELHLKQFKIEWVKNKIQESGL